MARKLTQEEFEQRVQDKYNGKYSVIGDYKKSTEKIALRCNQCGQEFTRVAADVIEVSGHTCCPVCDKNLITRSGVITGITDLWTTNPNVASMLKNPEEGYLYTDGSNVKTVFVCPICGNEKVVTIAQVARYGLSCNLCGDGRRYPNKFMSNLLFLNNIDYDSEYRLSGYQYRYDFHFILNGNHYLVEMDGGLNHGCVNLEHLTIEQQNAIDLEKDLLAERFGHKLIRVDCKYPTLKNRFSYIKTNILKSDLRYLLTDLSEDTLAKCDNKALTTSLVVEIADAWNGGICSVKTLSELFKVCKVTIRDHLENAIKIGLINESHDDVLRKVFDSGVASRAYIRGTSVMCNETGQVFASIADASRAGFSTVSKYLNHKIRYAGKLPDGTELTWKRITKEEYEVLVAS